MVTGLVSQEESWGGTRLNYNLGLSVSRAAILQIITSLAYEQATRNCMFRQHLSFLVHLFLDVDPPASLCVSALYPNKWYDLLNRQA